jgi:hypothetical protein
LRPVYVKGFVGMMFTRRQNVYSGFSVKGSLMDKKCHFKNVQKNLLFKKYYIQQEGKAKE